jgi:hypothetical protein
LVVAFLQSSQTYCLIYHSSVPALPATEGDEAVLTAGALLHQCMATLTRRKAAGTLLPGSCRPAEVEWFRAFQLRASLGRHMRADEARAFADTFAGAVGSETYCHAAFCCHAEFCSRDMANLTRGEVQLSFAKFLASALDLLASQPLEPMLVLGTFARNVELALARNVSRMMNNEELRCILSDEALKLVANAWRRVERSGVLEQRLLGRASLPYNPSKSLGAKQDEVAAEAAARGQHTCALAGCAAKEVHVSQFKKCGACRTVAYCCREHQVADWPSHKAACKAARKAAPKTDS